MPTMKARCAALLVFAVCILLASCATSGGEMSQKERDRIDREMARTSQKNAQAQDKAMRQSTGQNNQRGFGR